MARRRRSNTGIPGLSFSYKRALGISSAKRSFARATGIPTTRSGRRAKAGRMMGCLLPVLAALTIVSLFVLLIGSVAFAESIDFASLSDDALAQLIADAQAEQRSRKAQNADAAYQLPCVVLDVDGYKLEVTDVYSHVYEDDLILTMDVHAENQSEYNVEIDMSLKSYGDYDLSDSFQSEAIRVSSGKKANGTYDFYIRKFTDKSVKNFEFEVSVWDKDRSLYNLHRTETLKGLLP